MDKSRKKRPLEGLDRRRPVSPSQPPVIPENPIAETAAARGQEDHGGPNKSGGVDSLASCCLKTGRSVQSDDALTPARIVQPERKCNCSVRWKSNRPLLPAGRAGGGAVASWPSSATGHGTPGLRG